MIYLGKAFGVADLVDLEAHCVGLLYLEYFKNHTLILQIRFVFPDFMSEKFPVF